MDNISAEFLLQRSVATLIIILAGFLVYGLFRRAIELSVKRHKFHRHRAMMMMKLGRFGIRLAGLILVIGTWGFSVENIWIFLSGVIGLIAIGFFAVWSILSNIIAGMLLYFLNPFRIGENIILIGGDAIEGRVEDITLMYVNLNTADGRIHVPNNLFFQRALKVTTAKSVTPVDRTAQDNEKV